MIEINMTVTQEGNQVKTTIAAKTDNASTDAEVAAVDQFIEAFKEYFLEHGREATFIERQL